MIIKVYREISAWWRYFCFNAPGQIGFKLRSRVLEKAWKKKVNLHICTGIHMNGIENIVLGQNVSLGVRCLFESLAGKINVGNNVSFNSGVIIGSDFGEIEIGNDVLIGMNVVLRASSHNFDKSPDILIRSQGHKEGKITIGSDVWIGANSIILPNVTIGDHCVIGAGSVVNKNIPSNCVAVGNPAKVIKRILSMKS